MDRELSETQEKAIEQIACVNQDDSFLFGIVKDDKDIYSCLDTVDDDGQENVEDIALIMGGIIARTSSPENVEEYCELLCEVAKKQQNGESIQ